MPAKHRNLIGRIVADETMRRAYARTSRGRRYTHGALEFKEYAEANMARLSAEIADGSYRPDGVRNFLIYEPKPRMITAHSFRDRVAHHALVSVIGPIFEAAFLPRSYACRKGFGTHAGVIAVQAEMRRLGDPLHVLKTDFSAYFASIDRARLHAMIRRKIACRATLRLIAAITPPEGRGVPIGSLTSQLWANVYGGAADRFLHFDLGERHWHRYMDDIVVLGRDPGRLRDVRAALEEFAADAMGLRFSRWSVAPIGRGLNFLGYRIWPGHKLLRRSSVTRARRKLVRLTAGGETEKRDHFLAAWLGHARHADTRNLLASMELLP